MMSLCYLAHSIIDIASAFVRQYLHAHIPSIVISCLDNLRHFRVKHGQTTVFFYENQLEVISREISNSTGDVALQT